MDYGTGAIMAVPGGDQRDYDFAVKFGLPVIYTVTPLPDSGDDLANYEGKAPFVSHDGIVINSSVEATEAKGDALSLNGLRVDDAIAKVNAWLESAGVGKGTVSYRLRDWLFSRQRYWGEPFPIVYGEDGTPHLLPDSALPINLPDVPDYEPRTFDPMDAESNPGGKPLSRNEDWVKVELDLGDGKKTYYRDTNTMPNWAGSCWYYMRYIDPADTKHMVEKDEFDYWMGPNHNKYSGDEGGVDLYIGGVEHAVLHLLYSRFWHKVLFDLGYVDSAEPFHKLFNQGMIQAYAYTDDRGQYVPADRGRGRPGRRLRRADLHLERRTCQPRVRQDGQVPQEHRDPGLHVRELRCRHLPPVRNEHGPAGRVSPVEHPQRGRWHALPAASVAQCGR